MRVFDEWFFDLKEIRFKDDLPYLQQLLADCNITYQHLSFYMYSAPVEMCEKVTRLFPSIAAYRCAEDRFESIRRAADGTLCMHIDKEDEDTLAQLLTKIPRPINFAFVGVMFDGLSLGGEAPCDHRPDCLPDFRFAGYYSGSLRFFKEWDCGNKHNPVRLMIERIVDGDNLAPLSDAAKALIDALGKPIGIERHCVYDHETETAWSEATEAHKRVRLNNKDEYASLFEACVDKRPLNRHTIADMVTERLTPLSGVSPKKVITPIAKEHGYRFVKCRNGEYRYVKQNAHHHTFAVEVMIEPFTCGVGANVSASGHNFQWWLATSPEAIVRDELTLAQYMKAVFRMAADAETRYTDTLVATFGATPMWYDEGLS